MRKRITTILIMMIVLFTLPSTTCFASNCISVFIEDDTYKYPISFDTPPVIENGKVLVPMKAIFEELGYFVEWIPEKRAIRAVKITDDGNFMTGIVLWIDDCTARENNYVWDSDLGDYRDVGEFELTMDVPAKIINSRTMVPLRFIGETFGYYVTWDASTKTANLSIYTPDNTNTTSEPIDSQPVSDEQKAINDQYVQLFDEPVDSYPGAFQ